MLALLGGQSSINVEDAEASILLLLARLGSAGLAAKQLCHAGECLWGLLPVTVEATVLLG